jgi:putative acetyltransferase
VDRYVIRPEAEADHAAIAQLTTQAFGGHPYSAGTEAAIIEGLRSAGALSLSLVAVTADGEVVGHAAFSPVTVDSGDEGWFGLGPISVKPGRQREGVGSALIREGLDRLRGRGAAGCVLVGDAAYYGRFGFAPDPGAASAGLPPDHTMSLGFRGEGPGGAVTFHPAFGV